LPRFRGRWEESGNDWQVHGSLRVAPIDRWAALDKEIPCWEDITAAFDLTKEMNDVGELMLARKRPLRCRDLVPVLPGAGAGGQLQLRVVGEAVAMLPLLRSEARESRWATGPGSRGRPARRGAAGSLAGGRRSARRDCALEQCHRAGLPRLRKPGAPRGRRRRSSPKPSAFRIQAIIG
jgi:hypothetical protein